MAKKRNLAAEAGKVNASPFPLVPPLPKNGASNYAKHLREQLTKHNDKTISQVPLDELHGQKTKLKMTTMRHLGTTYPDPKWMEADNAYQHAKYPVVVKYNGKKTIHDGHHRATFAKLAGHKKLTSHYIDMDALLGPNNKLEKGGAGGATLQNGTLDGGAVGPDN